MTAKDTEIFNKAYPKLFEPLPPELGGSENPSEECIPQKVKEFLKRHLPPSDHKEIDEELNKNLPLSKQAKKKIKTSQPRKKAKKQLTAREKRDLGLFKVEKTSLKYETFKKLHYLWLEYMKEVLPLDQACPNKEEYSIGEGRTPAILDEQLQLKICRADLHGCLIKVTRALNACLVGLQGIVVMETRNTFRVIDKMNMTRTIPKQGTSFTFVAHNYVITLAGSSLIMKPSERAVKKWKKKPTFDL